MSEIDRDLQGRLKQLADEVQPDATGEGIVLERSRTKRRLVALTSGLMSLLLVGGIGGAAMLFTGRDGIEPAPARTIHTDLREDDLAALSVTEAAAILFLDDELEDAVPLGFSVDQIVRNGPQETNHDYATVGVRMDGLVDYARVIFFVHPDEPTAQAMYERELATARSYVRQNRAVGATQDLRPYVVANAAPGTKCGAGIDHLLACYALRGRVVMLTQSSAGRLGSQAEASDAEIEAAETLARSFSSYLEQVYPMSREKPRSTREQFRIEASPRKQRARVGERVQFIVRVRVPEGPVTLAAGAAWNDGSKGRGLGGQTDGCPSPSALPQEPRFRWKERRFHHVFGEAGRFRPTLEIYVESCIYSRSLSATVTVLVKD